MSMYWIYDIPNWQLGVLTVAVFVVVSLAGFFLTRPFSRMLLNGTSVHNDIVSYIFAGIGVFYGLALGLLAVATWEDFTQVDGQISTEAAVLASLYRDLDVYPEPLRGRFETKLRDYTRLVIEKDWPAHQHGEAPEEATLLLDSLENDIGRQPGPREKIGHAAAIQH